MSDISSIPTHVLKSAKDGKGDYVEFYKTYSGYLVRLYKTRPDADAEYPFSMLDIKQEIVKRDRAAFKTEHGFNEWDNHWKTLLAVKYPSARFDYEGEG